GGRHAIGAKTTGIHALTSRCRAESEISGESLGEYYLRPLAYQDGRDVTRKFSGIADYAGDGCGNPGQATGVNDLANRVCHFDGGIALYAERCVVDAESRRY